MDHYLNGPTIDDLQATNLAKNIIAGGEPIPEAGLTSATLRNEEKPAAFVKARFAAMLSGAKRYGRVCAQAVRQMDGHISTTLLRLLAHGRCDAAAWIVLSRHTDSMRLPGSVGGRTIISPNERTQNDNRVIDTVIFLGSNAYWTGNGNLDVTVAIPETTIAAAVGRPLAKLISHPALDGLELRITEIDDNGGDGYVVRTDHDLRPLHHRSVALKDLLPTHSFPTMRFDRA